MYFVCRLSSGLPGEKGERGSQGVGTQGPRGPPGPPGKDHQPLTFSHHAFLLPSHSSLPHLTSSHHFSLLLPSHSSLSSFHFTESQSPLFAKYICIYRNLPLWNGSATINRIYRETITGNVDRIYTIHIRCTLWTLRLKTTDYTINTLRYIITYACKDIWI